MNGLVSDLFEPELPLPLETDPLFIDLFDWFCIDEVHELFLIAGVDGGGINFGRLVCGARSVSIEGSESLSSSRTKLSRLFCAGGFVKVCESSTPAEFVELLI